VYILSRIKVNRSSSELNFIVGPSSTMAMGLHAISGYHKLVM